MQFTMVVCGLDSVDARRWISATLVNLVDPDVPESLKPMIDGGTEGSLVVPSHPINVLMDAAVSKALKDRRE